MQGSQTQCETESVVLLQSPTNSKGPCGDSRDTLQSCEESASTYRKGAVRLAWATVVLALLAVLAGFRTVPLLLSDTQPADFEAPDDSPSRDAFRQLNSKFPLFASGAATPVVFMVRAREGASTVLTDDVARWSEQLRADAETDSRCKDFAPVVAGYFLGAPILRIGAKDELLHSMYVAHDTKATIVTVMPTKTPDSSISDVLNATSKAKTTALIEFLHEHAMNPPDNCDVLLTGDPIMAYEREKDHSIENLLRAEIMVLPIALAVLAMLVRNPRLLIIPPIVLLVTFAAAATIVRPVGFLVPLSPDIPPAMLSLSVALCLDYTLFVLTRFNENRSCSQITLQENVDMVIHTTGRTITVSGLLIAISFFGALTLPAENLRSAGLSLGITTLVCMGVSATLGPAMLLLFGSSLTPKSEQALQRMVQCSDEESINSVAHRSSRATCQSPWMRLMRSVSMHPLVWVLVVVAFFAPLFMYVPMLQSSADSYAVMPGDMPSVAALRELGRHFPAGRFDPYAIIVTQDATGSKHEAGMDAYNTILELCDMVQDQGGVASIVAPMWLIDQRLDWESHQRLLRSPWAHDRNLYHSLLHAQVNGSSMLIQVHTNFSARGPGSAAWVENVRQTLTAWERAHSGYRAWLSGGASFAADSRRALMDSMPIYLGASVAAIMAVVFGLFQSVFLPIRLAFAILFSLGASFGAAVIVYQTPLLHGLFPGLANYSGITYEVIPLAAGVSVALGLDYDIFLISRIVEYRAHGMSDEVSIVKGVAHTGSIISGAGVIMALAFSGLFFSTKLLHQQFALLLVVSVLLDTFVVRTVLVPALMLNARGLNWWPRKMPESVKRSGSASVGLQELWKGIASVGLQEFWKEPAGPSSRV